MTVAALPSLPDRSRVPRKGQVCRGRSPAVRKCRSPPGWSDPRSRHLLLGPGRSFHRRFAAGENVYSFIKAKCESRGMKHYLEYLHGQCPYPAPSSSSSGASARDAADLACYGACCTSHARPAISSSSATDGTVRFRLETLLTKSFDEHVLRSLFLPFLPLTLFHILSLSLSRSPSPLLSRFLHRRRPYRRAMRSARSSRG